MEYTPVPADKQEDIKSPQRAAWFKALLDHGMIEMGSRPTLSLAQKHVLDERGERMRTRVLDDKTYIWVEEAPSLSDVYASSTGLADDEVPA